MDQNGEALCKNSKLGKMEVGGWSAKVRSSTLQEKEVIG